MTGYLKIMIMKIIADHKWYLSCLLWSTIKKGI